MLIKASAGSGKTYTLAKRYIELLLFAVGRDGKLCLRQQPGYHSHILAITFTNKATAEMKHRIVNELHILATSPAESDFFKDFCTQPDRFASGVLDEQGIKRAARRALCSVLFDYGTFNVSTIDSFFQGILRNFARELDRDYNYEVQIDEDLAMRTAIHNFLLSLGADARRTRHAGPYRLNDVERWVQDYIRQQVSEGKDWNFFKDDGGLLSFASLMNKEVFREQMPAMHHYLTRDEGNGRVSDLSRINDFRKRVVEMAKSYGQRYVAFAPTMRELMKAYEVDEARLWKGHLVAGLLKPDNVFALQTVYTEAFAELTEEKLVKNSFTKGYMPPQGFIDAVMSWRNEVMFTWNAWQLLAKMPDDLGLLALMSRIDDNLKEYSRETNQLLLADTNDLIAKVLDSGVPFLYERVATWINHFMIDEFQDTSQKQYSNFKPLLDEALSREGENLCMLIGDAKQSIYRFRNADPSLFRDGVSRDFTAGRHGLRVQNLDTNYRSVPSVVDFNNWFFDKILQRPEFLSRDVLQRTYAPGGVKAEFQQKKNKTTPQGLVRVTLVDKKATITDAQGVIDALPEYLLALHERYDWGQIGVLVNRNKEGVEVVNRIMEYNKTAADDKQIAVSSDEAMLIANSPGVKRIVSLLRFIDLTQYHLPEDVADDESNRKDDEPINSVRLREQRLYHVLGLFMERMAVEEASSPGQVLVQCFRDTDAGRKLADEEQMKRFADEVERILPDRHTEVMTVTNIVEHIIAHYMRDMAHASPETAHLLAFQDCVNDFASQYSGGTVREFLKFWDTKSDKLTVPASASSDSISVLTVHKSKGLEFDCVVIPFANWRLQGESGGAGRARNVYWLSKEELIEQGAMRLFDEMGGIDSDLIPPLVPLSKGEVRKLAKLNVCFESYVDKFEQDVLVDNMDKTYVAFTRPREEMHVFAFTDSELGKTMADIMRQGIETSDTALNQIDEYAYEWGEPASAGRDKASDLSASVTMCPMPPYRVCLGAARLNVRLPEDLTDKQNTGTRLHNLMSRIAYRRDVERAWGFCLNRGIIRADDRDWPLERIRGIIDRMFDDPRTCDWFADDNRVYNERNLSPGRVQQRVTKRPDRVVCRPDGTWLVIDYKFGEKNLEAHTRQVQSYMRRLSRMGKRDIRGFLWYVALDEIVPVSSGS